MNAYDFFPLDIFRVKSLTKILSSASKDTSSIKANSGVEHSSVTFLSHNIKHLSEKQKIFAEKKIVFLTHSQVNFLFLV